MKRKVIPVLIGLLLIVLILVVLVVLIAHDLKPFLSHCVGTMGSESGFFRFSDSSMAQCRGEYTA